MSRSGKPDICPNCGNACAVDDVLCPKCEKNLEDLFEKLEDVAVKFKRATPKWQWFDWVISFAILAPLLTLMHISQRGSSAVGICLDFGTGVVWAAVYSLTLRRLWIYLFPNRYIEWACSNCKKAVPKSADGCPHCKYWLEVGDSEEYSDANNKQIQGTSRLEEESEPRGKPCPKCGRYTCTNDVFCYSCGEKN